MSSNKTYPLSAWLILIVLALTWGSSFILMKRGLLVFNGIQLGALRISIAAICASYFGIRALRKIKSWQQLWPVMLIGVTGNFLPAFLFATAQTKLESSQAGILNALTPFFTFLIAIGFFQLKANWRSISGIAIGFAGAAGLITSKNGLNLNLDIGYSMLIVLATLCYGLSANIIANKCKELKSIDISTMAVTMVGLPALVVLFSSDFLTTMESSPAAYTALAYVAVLAICGTAIAVILYNKLIKDTTVMFGASVTYLMPVVAVLWGIVDGEHFTLKQLLFTGLILSGVYLVNYRSKSLEK